MTKEEATLAIKQHLQEFVAGDIIITLSGMSFNSKPAGDALGIPQLDHLLSEQAQKLITELSAYKAILENALKGQLAPIEEEWEEFIGE